MESSVPTKKYGLDERKSKKAIAKAEMEKLCNNYLIPGIENGDTKVVQHYIFIDLVYLMGHQGKEGLRKLQKDWFRTGVDDEGMEYVKIAVNETTKKNQGDNLSAAASFVHNDNNLMFTQPDSPKCLIKSFKKCMSLLSTQMNDFFQRPSQKQAEIHCSTSG